MKKKIRKVQFNALRLNTKGYKFNREQANCRESDISWAEEAERRIKQIQTGEITTIPGEEVFKENKESVESDKKRRGHGI